MASRRQNCVCCGLQLIVPSQAQAVCCNHCRSINHLQPQMSENPRPYRMLVQVAPPNFHREKRAFLCGISYKDNPEAALRLRGSINDVLSMRNLMVQKLGFPISSVLILSDDGPYEQPTKENILRAFEWLVKDSQSGDSLVFFYSGHATRQQEFNRDETDGFDEAICPMDIDTKGPILDNEINRLIVRPLKTGVVLHAIIDTCHSGTVLDLPHIYDRSSERWKKNDPPSGVYKGTSGGMAICISACGDHQQAAEVSTPERTFAGTMTHNFIKAITDKPGISYAGILEFIGNSIDEANTHLNRKWLTGKMLRFSRRKMLQDPQLSSSGIFYENLPFKL